MLKKEEDRDDTKKEQNTSRGRRPVGVCQLVRFQHVSNMCAFKTCFELSQHVRRFVDLQNSANFTNTMKLYNIFQNPQFLQKLLIPAATAAAAAAGAMMIYTPHTTQPRAPGPELFGQGRAASPLEAFLLAIPGPLWQLFCFCCRLLCLKLAPKSNNTDIHFVVFFVFLCLLCWFFLSCCSFRCFLHVLLFSFVFVLCFCFLFDCFYVSVVS